MTVASGLCSPVSFSANLSDDVTTSTSTPSSLRDAASCCSAVWTACVLQGEPKLAVAGRCCARLLATALFANGLSIRGTLYTKRAGGVGKLYQRAKGRAPLHQRSLRIDIS
jgi:hypothetical protein